MVKSYVYLRGCWDGGIVETIAEEVVGIVEYVFDSISVETIAEEVMGVVTGSVQSSIRCLSNGYLDQAVDSVLGLGI